MCPSLAQPVVFSVKCFCDAERSHLFSVLWSTHLRLFFSEPEGFVCHLFSLSLVFHYFPKAEKYVHDIYSSFEKSRELLSFITGADEKDSFMENSEDLYNTPVYNELYQTFSAAIAHHAFVPLCGIMGSKYMETALHNHDLIWNLCCSYDAQLSHPTCEDTRASEDEEDREETGDHSGGAGTVEVDSGAGNSHGLDTGAEERARDKKDGKDGGKFKKRHMPPMWLIGRKLSKTKDVPTSL